MKTSLLPLLVCVALSTGALLSGCGGKAAADDPAPVAACREYEAALASCFHRDVSFATQPGLLARTDADRVRIGAICADSLTRLRATCH